MWRAVANAVTVLGVSIKMRGISEDLLDSQETSVPWSHCRIFNLHKCAISRPGQK